MKNYIKLMRPKHYIKNLLIFLPLVFNGTLFNENFYQAILGFICFCLMASGIYVINDIKDKDKDKIHKTKCNRPIASGKISIKNAITFLIFIILAIILIIIFSHMKPMAMLFLILYFLINLAYSFGLKNVPIFDISIIASGFILRILYGAALLDIEVSNWLLLTIMTISLYLALGKRKKEIEYNGIKSRKVLKSYTLNFLNNSSNNFLTMAVIFYSLWACDNSIVKANNNLMIWTIPLVIFLALRYNLVIENNKDGDPTEVILGDKIILIWGFILALMFIGILYLG